MTPPVRVVHLGQQPPESYVAAVYLGGPAQPSWRAQAVELLRRWWNGAGELVVFSPEPERGSHCVPSAEQAVWEEQAMRRADVLLLHIPPGIPDLVANLKWGAWCASGRAVLSCPPEADGLPHFAEQHGVPVGHFLEEAVWSALGMLAGGARRSGGARSVPLLIWRTPQFQRWLRRLADGEQLLDARVDWVRHAPADAHRCWSIRVLTRVPGAQAAWRRLSSDRPDEWALVAHGEVDGEPVVLLTGDHPALPGGPLPGDGAPPVAAALAELGLCCGPERVVWHAPAPADVTSAHVVLPRSVQLSAAELVTLPRAALVVPVATLTAYRGVAWSTFGVVAGVLSSAGSGLGDVRPAGRQDRRPAQPAAP
ncbi:MULTISPECIES: nucleoside 2-deoxyribosyltransferase domain-containing protein [unclassified Crossiella]|uniref:nucleoside 2-deoxyribosyltransferase domain-containing protein n=1 Tax=unclassified Crossiella TaxID=2620835 RepID=UPI001FFF5B02|nr:MULTISPECIES: nucleoside 2-deoxyribosyltransferase domain-containing protein [unclassified Crossiella]MCK2244625.1 nucleoside 2-deoxyribosyltransferase domain-containing protein [Crossiella sp. S99.2]MCK2258388.1 nucleoside 2-deoxyribosyltransferase domain-containing protein [Crossiella sp. S99.1]